MRPSPRRRPGGRGGPRCRRDAAADLLVIAALWLDPAATDPDEVFADVLAATDEAIAAAVAGSPSIDEVLAEARHPWNAHYHRHRN